VIVVAVTGCRVAGADLFDQPVFVIPLLAPASAFGWQTGNKKKRLRKKESF
jgi:hypothetical protein